MRPTGLGLGAMVMFALTVASALSTGNNLLYLLFGSMAGALCVGMIGAALDIRRLRVTVEAPEQAFRGSEAPLRVTVANPTAWDAWAVEVALPGARVRLGRVPARGTAEATLRARLPHRGLNLLSGLALETVFPFALFRRRVALPAPSVLALPRLREVRAPAEARAQAKPAGRPTLRKGSGEELYGLREYTASDDARMINWKVSARSARPLVNEYAGTHDAKVVVRASGGGDEAVEEAASVCRYYIDAGSEVALELPDRRVDFGRGLLHLDKLLRAAALSGDGGTPRPYSAQSPRRPPLTLDEPMRRLMLFGAALVFAAMFLIDEIKPSVLLLCAPILALGAPVQLRRRAVLPSAVWTVLSLGMLTWIIVYDWRASGVAVANVHLLLYLLANRVLTPFEDREGGQVFLILFLAFFLVSGLTISLWYFGYFLVWAAFCTAWLSAAAGLKLSAWRAWARTAGVSAAASLGVAALLFMAVPRVEGLRRINPFVAAGIDKLAVKSSNVMGFTENVSLGFFGELKKSSARVMRVKPLPTGSRPPALYVRGSAFDTFDGRKWSKTPTKFGVKRLGGRIRESRALVRRQGDQLIFPAPAPANTDQTSYEFQIYPMSLSVLFTVGTPWVVDGITDPAWYDHTESVKLASPYITGIRYRERPSPSSGFEDGITGYEELLKARYLTPLADPGGHRASLVANITRGADSPDRKVEAITKYLRRAYAYSTYSEDKNKDVDAFLFREKSGNCEYFASAAVVLFRQAGIPARLVTGFLVDDWNQYGLFFDVRQSDAHAWAEAYLPGRGWTLVDATPGQGALGLSAEALSRRFAKWFDAAQTQWYRRVIGYDFSIQRDTFRRISSFAAPRALEQAGKGFVKIALTTLATLGLWSVAAWLYRRWKAPPRSPYLRAEELLARAGLPRRPDLTPREYARDVRARRPELSAVSDLAELEYRERYGGQTSTVEERAQARHLLSELRRKL